MSIPTNPRLDKATQYEYLTDTSPRDKPWDLHRSSAETVEAHLKTAPEGWIEKQGKRVEDCSRWLKFAMTATDQGEMALKLRQAPFCRVRTCPVCQWRRSLMWKARFHQALPEVMAQYPKGRWLFLTLTVKNCRIQDLRQTLGEMNTAWHRLVKRKEFRHVIGWARATEIPRADDGKAHPHFHCLLLVKASYFNSKANYVTTEEWAKAWGECLRVDYTPITDVRAVKDRQGKGDLVGAIAETFKYTVKPSHLTVDPDWLIELVRQTHKTRAIASGGALKNALRQDDEDLLVSEGETAEQADAPELRFSYSRQVHRYRRRSTPVPASVPQSSL